MKLYDSLKTQEHILCYARYASLRLRDLKDMCY